jgi:hypothetical protein
MLYLPLLLLPLFVPEAPAHVAARWRWCGLRCRNRRGQRYYALEGSAMKCGASVGAACTLSLTARVAKHICQQAS